MMPCKFDNGDSCLVLKQHICGKCKFYKSHKDFDEAQAASKARLRAMGLIAVKVPSDDGRGDIITVEEGFDEYEGFDSI